MSIQCIPMSEFRSEVAKAMAEHNDCREEK